jgi:DNA-binding IclR family transcriptional regulator
LDRGAAGRAIVAYRDHGSTTYIVTQGELQVGAFGIAAPVVDVPGIEASVGVISFGELDPARTGPRIVRAAAEVAKALR